MAVYKVPQDVEADDKLIGPFSFKQFVFILITVGMLWVAYIMARISPFLAMVPAILAIPFLVLGMPLRKEQPTDVYVAALINFFMRPKVRTWSQEGIVKHVEITAPKKVESHIGDGLSRVEVRSRLSNLAKTMDTRGWSAKNLDPITAKAMSAQSDRLVQPDMQPTTTMDMPDVDDVMDARNSAVAQKFAQLEAEAAMKRGDVATAQTLNPQAPVDEGPGQAMPGSVILPGQQPAPQPEPASPTNQPPPDLTAGAPVHNPFPQMQQKTLNPVHSKDEINELESAAQGIVSPNTQPPQQVPTPQPEPAPQPEPTPPVTETPPTDIIDNNSPSVNPPATNDPQDMDNLEGGGEIPLR